MHAAGPLSQDEYEQVRSLSSGTGGGRLKGAGTLTRCNFDLSIAHDDIQGELFIAHRTERLYVAMSVEELLLISQIQSEQDQLTRGSRDTFSASLFSYEDRRGDDNSSLALTDANGSVSIADFQSSQLQHGSSLEQDDD